LRPSGVGVFQYGSGDGFVSCGYCFFGFAPGGRGDYFEDVDDFLGFVCGEFDV
jgi:hypothetical protein